MSYVPVFQRLQYLWTTQQNGPLTKAAEDSSCQFFVPAASLLLEGSIVGSSSVATQWRKSTATWYLHGQRNMGGVLLILAFVLWVSFGVLIWGLCSGPYSSALSQLSIRSASLGLIPIPSISQVWYTFVDSLRSPTLKCGGVLGLRSNRDKPYSRHFAQHTTMAASAPRRMLFPHLH